MTDSYKFICTTCDFRTNHPSRWKQHTATDLHKTGKRKPRSDKKHLDKCPKCNYTAKSNTTLKQHILIKHGTTEEKQTGFSYYCQDCDYGTFAKPSYDKHCLTTKHKQMSTKHI